MRRSERRRAEFLAFALDCGWDPREESNWTARNFGARHTLAKRWMGEGFFRHRLGCLLVGKFRLF